MFSVNARLYETSVIYNKRRDLIIACSRMEVSAVERPSFSGDPFPRHVSSDDGMDIGTDPESHMCALALLEYARSTRPVLHDDVQYWLRLFGVNGDLGYSAMSRDCFSTSPSTTDSSTRSSNQFEVGTEFMRSDIYFI